MKKLAILILIILPLSISIPLVNPVDDEFGLKYVDSINIHSTKQLTTSSSTLVEDAEASTSFYLSEARVLLVIYSACNYHYTSEDYRGKTIGLKVDDLLVATSSFSSFGSFNLFSGGGVVVWAGILGAGHHSVKGFFSNNGGGVVTISERRLTILLFEGTTDDFMYARSVSPSATSSSSLLDDPEAFFTFDSVPCKALILYQASNQHSTSESLYGKRIAISTDGSDGLSMASSPYMANYADSAFVAEIRTLSSGSHKIKGRFASSQAASTVTVSERQFAVLFFPKSLETDFVESSTQVTAFEAGSGTGSSLQVDPEAMVSKFTRRTRNVFALYCASKRSGTASSKYGKKVGVKIDGRDYGTNCQSPGNSGDLSPRANSIGIQSDVVELRNGKHDVTGSFANNALGWTAVVDDRMLCVLWFITPEPVGGELAPTNLSSILYASVFYIALLAGMGILYRKKFN